MSISTSQTAIQQDQYGQPLADVTERGLAIYESQLKALLEPDHLGEVVAIHVDSGEYAVAVSSPDALRAMRRLQPSGLLFLYTIGPAEDLGLARRMSGLATGTARK
jgi:hypothetical protein